MDTVQRKPIINSRYILIFITLLGMEISWLYALLTAANKSVSDILSIPLLLLILLISTGTTAALQKIHWPKIVLTAISWIIWAIVMLLMIKVQLFRGTGLTNTDWLMAVPRAAAQMLFSFEPALLIFLCSIALWWLGRRLAFLKPVFSTAMIEFQLGLIVLMLVFFIAYELNLDQSGSIPVALIFFSLALTGLSISHSQENNGWLNTQRPGHWSGMLVASIVLILFMGILISVIFSPELIQLFIKAIKWVWGEIEKIIAFLASLFPQTSGDTSAPPTVMPGGQNPEEIPKFNFPEWLSTGLRLAWNVFMIGFLVFVVWRIATQLFGWMRKRGSSFGGERETLKGALKLDILNWIKRILAKLFRIKFGPSTRDKFKNVPPEIASVRQLYSQLLRWAAQKGHPRQSAQTPDEFRNILNEEIPDNELEMNYITQEYMKSRYGSNIPSEAELEQLKQKWNNLHNTGFKSSKNKNLANKG